MTPEETARQRNDEMLTAPCRGIQLLRQNLLAH
jgi:hypothetical protein